MNLNLSGFYLPAILPLFLLLLGLPLVTLSQQAKTIQVPYLNAAPVVDGDLSEWKAKAFSDGSWDLERLQKCSWYEPKRNRLVVHEGEDDSSPDLSAQYYIAWDEEYLYFGAEVQDNTNDVSESKHAPKRWYYKDAIAWFIEAPRDTIAETFGEGNHGFCFVMDTTMPDYGAWWRHGSKAQNYLEEPLPEGQFAYSITMNPWNQSKGDYIFEAKVAHKSTLGSGAANWTTPKSGDRYSMMIVHCDPDGGEYGGHLLIYGQGDNDSSWVEIMLYKPTNE